METNIIHKTELSVKINRIGIDLQAVRVRQNRKNIVVYSGTYMFLNAEINALSLKITDECPELVQYMSEMQAAIPDQKSTAISRKDLVLYYQALSSMLNGYLAANPHNLSRE